MFDKRLQVSVTFFTVKNDTFEGTFVPSKVSMYGTNRP
jgi:hypothetical protein